MKLETPILIVLKSFDLLRRKKDGAEGLLHPPESKNRFWRDHSDGIAVDVHGLRDEHVACQFVNVS